MRNGIGIAKCYAVKLREWVGNLSTSYEIILQDQADLCNNPLTQLDKKSSKSTKIT